MEEGGGDGQQREEEEEEEDLEALLLASMLLQEEDGDKAHARRQSQQQQPPSPQHNNQQHLQEEETLTEDGRDAKQTTAGAASASASNSPPTRAQNGKGAAIRNGQESKKKEAEYEARIQELEAKLVETEVLLGSETGAIILGLEVSFCFKISQANRDAVPVIGLLLTPPTHSYILNTRSPLHSLTHTHSVSWLKHAWPWPIWRQRRTTWRCALSTSFHHHQRKGRGASRGGRGR